MAAVILTVIISFAMAIRLKFTVGGVGNLNVGQVKFKKGPRAARWTKDANIVHQDTNLYQQK